MPGSVGAAQEKPIPAQFRDATLFKSAIRQSKEKPSRATVTGITVPHHLLARDLIADAFARASLRHDVDRVIILSPDHFFTGKTPISIARRDFNTPFGLLSTDQKLAEKILAVPAVSRGKYFYREHGINALTPFVKYHFPQANVVAIAIKEGTPQRILDPFVEALKNSIDARTLIVQSTDFSHYLTKREADVRDQETIRVLNSDKPTDLFTLSEPKNLDSIASQYVQMRLQGEAFGSSLTILAVKNSQSYAREPVSRTTSYITQIYTHSRSGTPKGIYIFAPFSGANMYIPEGTSMDSDSLLVVGDIMLGRAVETLMKKRGQDYPFSQTKELLKQSSLVVGNLEGPINRDHRQTPDGSLSFSFPSSTAALLKRAGLTHVTLGNNHTGDRGATNLEFTRETLRNAGVLPFGDPATIDSRTGTSRVTLNGIPTLLLSINDAARQNTPIKNALELISREQKDAPDQRIIVFIHWGTEYSKTPSKSQRDLAHALIDAGADAIIGHHPHVVQSIERYKNAPIVYSLGNFIFDQYFSRDTQEMLAVKLIWTQNGAQIALFPLESGQSAPRPMTHKQRASFFDALAARSDPGTIHIDGGPGNP